MKKLFAGLSTLAVLCPLSTVLCLPSSGQVTPTSLKYALTNANEPFALGGTDYTNLTAAHGVAPIDIWQGRGLSLQIRVVGNNTATTTGLVAAAFAPSIDGTNYCNQTNQYFWVFAAPNGTTEAFGWTNISANFLNNIRKLKLVQITNNNCATNMRQWVTNVTVSQQN
jgi:hypothetical protein